MQLQGVTFHTSQHFCSKTRKRKTWLLSLKHRWCGRLRRPQADSGTFWCVNQHIIKETIEMRFFFKTASKSSAMIVTYRYYWRLELQVIEVEPASELDVPSAWKCQLWTAVPAAMFTMGFFFQSPNNMSCIANQIPDILCGCYTTEQLRLW